ncbi:MAG: thiolase family protein, partial [Candidatus Eremiobacteraeota bacterium]|nr:thiolase family protein [Candidatus Eremiobacteraeota bacterium]
YEISREQSDEFSLRSQRAAVQSMNDGFYAEEIAPVEVRDRKGSVLIDKDEGPRPDTSAEKLAKLPTRFKKDGVVTAGNASGITDGAAAVVLTSEAQAERDGLQPLGRVVSWGVVGVDPDVMGIGPAFAIPQALQRADLTLDEIDVVEINEAFAPQVLACMDELSLEIGRVNPNGGAISLGHPLGASGTRLAYTLLHELRRRKKKFGVASACIGGGQGIAAILEAL